MILYLLLRVKCLSNYADFDESCIISVKYKLDWKFIYIWKKKSQGIHSYFIFGELS